jgi:hypothetical protein
VRGIREGEQPLASAPLGQQRQVVHDGGVVGDMIVGRVQMIFDRGFAGDAVEFVLQALRGRFQGEFLVEGGLLVRVMGGRTVGHRKVPLVVTRSVPRALS